ncbi:MAG: hypothetical protein HOD43_02045, partial [Candidatus Marinimicrobia bacterium]|nr:hypothetical protein [Candidatus Neomarinimicrobiota bacterium]MBT3823543.1 hypothetical protein [Candidatus Neomarinimicrobiota bacterium]MBT4129613.1 hypothetical protein [Candidatus Neomarinimicrobiota bacterium]MBT4294570.1 hypothetical protein [Candidatus Neomarinimicrobiota bacterium]MBT4420246.1 hypothetical protein [Candidatus Neomarinimicrobiota bacterium]
MKTLNIFFIILIAMVVSNCENPRYVEAGVIWTDDSYFSADGDWYLAISDGCYSNCEGATLDILEQMPISVNRKTTQKFVLGSGAEGNLTAFVYLDINKNGIYEDGYDKLTGYKYN